MYKSKLFYKKRLEKISLLFFFELVYKYVLSALVPLHQCILYYPSTLGWASLGKMKFTKFWWPRAEKGRPTTRARFTKHCS
jgi:hypothetical protein